MTAHSKSYSTGDTGNEQNHGDDWPERSAWIKLLKECNAVKAEEMTVLKWEASRNEPTFQHERLEVDLWLVKFMAEQRNKVWVRGGTNSPAFKEIRDKIGRILPEDIAGNNSGGFVMGKALSTDKTAILRTCGGLDRPRFVFRVTHEGTSDGKIKPMPFGGLKARGYGSIKTDPIHFQDLVQLHLNWNWRGKSPFISVAVHVELALLFCEAYTFRRCRGIKLHVIKTSGKEWDHANQRMFRVNDLVDKLKLRSRDVYHAECLVENSIPEGSVVRTVTDWKRIPPRWKSYMRSISDCLRWNRHAQEIEKKMRAVMKEQTKGEKKPREKIESRPRSKGFQRVNWNA